MQEFDFELINSFCEIDSRDQLSIFVFHVKLRFGVNLAYLIFRKNADKLYERLEKLEGVRSSRVRLWVDDND